MARDALQTVTLPILVEEGTKPEGSFSSGTSIQNVRVISPGEIRKAESQIFKDESRNLFRALAMLKHAYEAADGWELNEAMELLQPWMPRWPKGVTVTVNPEKVWAKARWDYTSLMTAAMESARLVMWFTPLKKREKILSPAIYCPDLKTAAFVAAYLGGIRVCPKCHTPFVPSSDNVSYCTPAHGVAHRTTRSRRNKKAKQIELAN